MSLFQEPRHALRTLGRSPGFSAVTAVLGGCAFFAAYLPARRASRIDPIAALRTE